MKDRALKGRKPKTRKEFIVNQILCNDGVEIVDVDRVATPLVTSLAAIARGYPKGVSWAKRVINTFNSAFFNSATLICQNKNEGCRRHRHPDCDEVWVILAGRMEIETGKEREKRVVSAGDIVYLKKGTDHKLTVISDKPGIRLSVSVEAMVNIYSE